MNTRPWGRHGFCVAMSDQLAMQQPSSRHDEAQPGPGESGASASGSIAVAQAVEAREGGEAPGLAGARASFRTLARISSDLVLIHRDGQVIYINPASVRALGVASADDLVGVALADVFHQDNHPIVESRVRAPRASATTETFGLLWRAKGGTYRTTEAAASPIDFDGSAAVVVVARDVTERAEFQHQLLQRDRMAALGTLSAGVAHEINNPLTYLLVNLEHVLRRLRAASASDDPMAELSQRHDRRAVGPRAVTPACRRGREPRPPDRPRSPRRSLRATSSTAGWSTCEASSRARRRWRGTRSGTARAS